MSDGHWLDDAPTDEARETAVEPSPPAGPLGLVASRLAAVSPDWAACAAKPSAAPDVSAAVRALGSDRAQGVEAIREGWLLHRSASRIVAGASPDLALLIGDWCYADGLCVVADHGSLDDVARLARLIAESAAEAGEAVGGDPLERRWDETIQELQHG